MLLHTTVAIVGIVLLTAGWVGVQRAWRRTFPAAGRDVDVLAGRQGCGGCDAMRDDERPCRLGACVAEEEKR